MRVMAASQASRWTVADGIIAARVEPRRRRARNPRQGVYVGRDDELWPWTGAVARELARPPADLDQGVGAALSGSAVIILAGQHVRVERRPQGGTALGIQQAI